jgi:hypothetical protein
MKPEDLRGVKMNVTSRIKTKIELVELKYKHWV